MEIVMMVVLWGFIALCIFFVILWIVCNLICAHYLNRMVFELPWKTWLTYEQVVAYGYPGSLCGTLLYILYDANMLEVRPAESVKDSVARTHLIEMHGVDYVTIKWHDIKLTHKRKRRKPQIDLKSIFSGLGWNPGYA